MMRAAGRRLTCPCYASLMSARAYIMALLLVMAFIVVPIGGAHLHLCFDGQEPAVSMHVSDGEAHHSRAQISQSHEDMDLSAVGEVAAKKFERNLDLAALLAVTIVLLLRWDAVDVSILQFASSPAHSPSIFSLLPPLRGPPV